MGQQLTKQNAASEYAAGNVWLVKTGPSVYQTQNTQTGATDVLRQDGVGYYTQSIDQPVVKSYVASEIKSFAGFLKVKTTATSGDHLTVDGDGNLLIYSANTGYEIPWDYATKYIGASVIAHTSGLDISIQEAEDENEPNRRFVIFNQQDSGETFTCDQNTVEPDSYVVMRYAPAEQLWNFDSGPQTYVRSTALGSSTLHYAGNGACIKVTATSAQTITNFSGSASEGDRITVHLLDANVGISSSATIALDSSDGNYTAQAGGASFEFQLIGTVWTELSRRVF